MAYEIRRPEDDPRAAPAYSAQGGPAMPAFGTGGAGANPSGAPKGSKFVNFDRLFSANKGGAEQMATGLENAVETSVNDYNTAVGAAEDSFGKAVQAGVSNDATYTRGVGAYDPKTQSGTVTVTPTRNPYSGPTDFKAWATDNAPGVRDAEGKAAETLQATEDPYAVQAYLQRQNAGANGGYTYGMSKMDAALTSTAGGNRFATLRNRYGNLGSAMDSAAQRAAGVVSAAQNLNATPPPASLETAERLKREAEARAAAAKQQARETKAEAGVSKKDRNRTDEEGRNDRNAGRYY